MTHQEREKVFEYIQKEIKKIRETKGYDYTLGTGDANRNFKKVAEVLGLTPEQVLWVYVEKHLDAIRSFIKSGELKGEGIEAKILDVINYLGILYSLLLEEGKIKNTKIKHT